MSELVSGLPAEKRIILAIDKSEKKQAEELAELAHDAGAYVVKLGLEISSATSWKTCSKIAKSNNLDWVADAKIDDISNTTEGIMKNLARLKHPPVGVTIHTNSGLKSMEAAQAIAEKEGMKMLAVTHLTGIEDEETKMTYGFLRKTLVKRRALQAARAGIGGLVASPREIAKPLKSTSELVEMFTMIPGTRSPGADAHDQKNALTPYNAIVAGADTLVIGRQVTESSDPSAEFMLVAQEIDLALKVVKGEI